MTGGRLKPWLVFGLVMLSIGARAASEPVRIGCKNFTENFILAELAAQLLEDRGFAVERRFALGGSLIAYEALKTGEIDLSPDYTGTLVRAIYADEGITEAELPARLGQDGLEPVLRWGFNNSYAVAVRTALAETEGLERVSDLAQLPALRFGFSHEFLNRGDGWPGLSARYGLTQETVGLEHALAYRAVESGKLDATDAYTTDGELAVFALTVLEDDRDYFPRYDAILVGRKDLDPAAAKVLAELDGRLDAQRMRALNKRAAIDGESPAAVAAGFLRDIGLVTTATSTRSSLFERVSTNTLRHLQLTGIALVLACLVAVPAALFVARHPRLARSLLYLSGLLQTIPSLALLALLVPLMGLGTGPAITALFVYSLLPIIRNTLTGLFSVDPLLVNVAEGMGLTRNQRLLRVELPLAAPAILAGIKTAAIISIGTATLAAFVGGGGLGEPIITGLSLNDPARILEGALPAAVLAILVELAFEAVESRLVPAHLRKNLSGSAL